MLSWEEFLLPTCLMEEYTVDHRLLEFLDNNKENPFLHHIVKYTIIDHTSLLITFVMKNQ